MNMANLLTLLRVALTFVMAALLTLSAIPFGKTIALAVFVVASVTDYWDGRLARSRYGTTAFGELMDPLADKILVCAAFVSFVAWDHLVPAWVVIVVISRDFLITGLRLLGATHGQVIPADRLGKHKTAWQIVLIIVIMVGLSLKEDILPAVLSADALRQAVTAHYATFRTVVRAVSMAVAALTVVSGVVYIWRGRHIYMQHF